MLVLLRGPVHGESALQGGEALAAGPGPEEEGEVTGYAYHTSDVQEAFQDAVTKLYKLYAGHINATVSQIGFVAIANPLGIAYTYVRMKQQSS